MQIKNKLRTPENEKNAKKVFSKKVKNGIHSGQKRKADAQTHADLDICIIEVICTRWSMCQKTFIFFHTELFTVDLEWFEKRFSRLIRNKLKYFRVISYT